MKKAYFILLIGLNVFLFGCSSRITDGGDGGVDKRLVSQVGNPQTFELATWNIENFPKSGDNTINNLEQLIKDLDIDLIAVEEVADQSKFNLMISNLSEWRSVLSDDEYYPGSYQKTGIVYRYSQISLKNARSLFTEEGYIFPRPPLYAYIEVKDGATVKFDFNLIVMHLKAYSDEESISRRRQACLYLENYIHTQIAAGADSDFVVVGDWNDQLEKNDERDVFTPFLSQPALYTFLTEALISDYSYIKEPFKNVIDHIMITESVKKEYGAGQTIIPAVDTEYSSYVSYISDHRPVVAIFKGFSLQ